LFIDNTLTNNVLSQLIVCDLYCSCKILLVSISVVVEFNTDIITEKKDNLDGDNGATSFN